MFISHVPEGEATGDVAEIYQKEREWWGYLPNYAQLFSHRPAVLVAWRNLNASIREGMDRRLYELATLSAATTLHSSYCSLAHGKFLTEFYEPSQVVDVLGARSTLPTREAMMMDFAVKVAGDASAITQADVAALREAGFSDTDIFDVAATAAARCFFAKLLDALGAQPDHQLNELDPNMVGVLTVGRPIAPAAT
ncbi:MAG: carboxymuconolactone decarboxylase family protein [Acidimicrobiia bacterium]|nr:carboxymuconolactone decarboxylase family protein [Acidimicrobiia bacterium]